MRLALSSAVPSRYEVQEVLVHGSSAVFDYWRGRAIACWRPLSRPGRPTAVAHNPLVLRAPRVDRPSMRLRSASGPSVSYSPRLYVLSVYSHAAASLRLPGSRQFAALARSQCWCISP
jgi:hypothetical protein